MHDEHAVLVLVDLGPLMLCTHFVDGERRERQLCLEQEQLVFGGPLHIEPQDLAGGARRAREAGLGDCGRLGLAVDEGCHRDGHGLGVLRAVPASCGWGILAGAGTWRSLVAHLLWEQGVGGSNPPVPTITAQRAGVAQLARASAFQAEGRGFEARLPLHFFPPVTPDASVTLRRARSSAGQSIGLLIRRSQVRILPGAPVPSVRSRSCSRCTPPLRCLNAPPPADTTTRLVNRLPQGGTSSGDLQ